jgi:hypothetical protein
LSGTALNNPDAFKFSFKILDANQRLVCWRCTIFERQ